MKRIILFLACLLCLMLGIGLGSYLEYTSRTAKNYRRILKEHQCLKETFNMTDAELIEAAKKVPQFFEDEKRQEEMAAAFALGAFRDLAKRNIEDT